MTADNNTPQRIGAALQRFPFAYQAAATGVKAVGFVRRKAQIAAYLDGTERRYLRLGSGSHTDPGWLAADLIPVSRDVVFMDVTRPLPLPSASFDAVQCEHLIECIPYEAGLGMLQECHRVLRAGGVLRIATPDLDLVRRLVTREDSDPRLVAYIEWSNREFGTPAEQRDIHNGAFAANRLMHGSGTNTFIWDEHTLRSAMQTAGFHDIVRVLPGESSHEELRDVDRHHEEIGKEADALEKLALEATA